VVVTAKAGVINPRLFPGGVRSFDLSKPAEKRSFDVIENALRRRDVPYRVERGRRKGTMP
jgi:hypothetical protein